MEINFLEFLSLWLLIVNYGANSRAVGNSALNVASIDYKCQPYSYEIAINQIDLNSKTFKGSLSLILEITTKTDEVNLDSKTLSYENDLFKYSIIECSEPIDPDYTQVCTNFCSDKPNSKLCENLPTRQLCINNSSSSQCQGIYTIPINGLTNQIRQEKALPVIEGTLTHDDTNNKVNLAFDEEIENKLIIVTLDYMGILNTDMKGFYHSEEENGKKLACTKFEPTDASMAFPCADDPSLKARFKISITVPSTSPPDEESYTAISNMNIEDNYPQGDIYKFQETPLMSTYLVAWVVSKFKYLNTENKYRVFAASDQYEKGMLALEFAPKVINLLNEYTESDYFDHMHKMDQVAIPDFSAGAMENWGLVTYRERRILWDENTMTTSAKQSILTVISHELAHQWFGNLVSPEHWGLLWLNEGFATYFEFFTTAELTFGLNLEEQFVSIEIRDAFEIDSVKSARSMTVQKDNIPLDIRDIFDSISYSKAGSVLYMFKNALSEEVFKNALREYIRKYKEGNGNPEKLFDEFINADTESKQIPEDIAMEFYKSWTEFPGYPLLSAIRENNKILLNQNRFLTSEEEGEEKIRWIIPIEFVTKSNRNSPNKYLMKKNENDSLNLPDSTTESDWYLLNYKHSGYYRVNYDDKNWDDLTNQLKEDHSQIHIYSRIQLVDDILTLAEGGKISFDKAFNLISYLKNEKDFGPWKVAINRFKVLLRKITDENLYTLLKKYLQNLTKPFYDNIGFYSTNPDNENDYVKIARAEVVDWTCFLGLEECISKAKELFNKHKTTKSLAPDYLNLVFCNGIREGNVDEWNFIWELHEDKKTSAEKTILYPSLGCTPHVDVLNKYLESLMSSTSSIRAQDHASVLSSVYNNPKGIDVMLEFLSKNYNKLGTIGYKSTFRGLSKMITSESQKSKAFSPLSGVYIKRLYFLYTPEDGLKFAEFKKSTTDEKMNVLLDECLQTIDINLKWNQDVLPNLNTWIDANLKETNNGNLSNVDPISIVILSLATVFLLQNFI